MSQSVTLRQKVALTFQFSNLPKMDLLSKSDPMLVLYRYVGNQRILVGRTDPIMNNEDPIFDKRFEIDYFFEQVQKFSVMVYDVDSTNYDRFEEHDFIGSVEFTLASVMSSFNSTLSIQLQDIQKQPLHKTSLHKTKENKSLAIIRGDQIQVSRNKFQFQLSCKHLTKTSFFFKDDVQLKLMSLRGDKHYTTVFKSEIHRHDQNPLFNTVKIDMAQLCDNNVENPILFRICAVKNDNDEHIIGELRTTVAELLATGTTTPFNLVNPNKSNKVAGTAHFLLTEQVIEYTFLDYVQGGLDLNLSIAIDFTASNGDPANSRSLHYLTPGYSGAENDYTRAITSVGDIIVDYCHKQSFPALGFGGFVSIDGQPSQTLHCFPLSQRRTESYATGIPHLIQLYRQCLSSIQLSGPTYFHELIESATLAAQRPYSETYQHFNILLIITDGVINDMAQSIDEIVKGSRTPLSIIIIGVGQADFETMEALDSDDTLLESMTQGRAERDIVQFVPFAKFAGNREQLAAEVLAEIPEQVTQFMAMRKIKPLQRRA